jgi:hypothetical protein
MGIPKDSIGGRRESPDGTTAAIAIESRLAIGIGNPNWQSNQLYVTDNDTSPVPEVLFRDTWSNDKDGLDKPDRPPEPWHLCA